MHSVSAMQISLGLVVVQSLTQMKHLLHAQYFDRSSEMFMAKVLLMMKQKEELRLGSLS
jgi:hypothetical protein